jgi:heme/copper-type cytochrome/quinol oxidase subunit 2
VFAVIAFVGFAAVLAACSDSAATTTTTVAATSLPSATTSAPTTTESAPTTTEAPAPPPTVTTTSTVVATTSTTEAPAATTIEISVTGGAVEGPGRVSVPLGDLVVLTVTADVTDEVHFHGYDISVDVAPGRPAILELEADIPGVFEVELEGARLELVVVEVK